MFLAITLLTHDLSKQEFSLIVIIFLVFTDLLVASYLIGNETVLVYIEVPPCENPENILLSISTMDDRLHIRNASKLSYETLPKHI
jgi:hypothetical protein